MKLEQRWEIAWHVFVRILTVKQILFETHPECIMI